MRTIREIEDLLDELESHPADELQAQDLDFKQWDTSSLERAIHTVVDWAICMANGGGGTVVFGVADKCVGRQNAILGVPLEIEIHRLQQAVYDRTDPKLTPTFEELRVPEGTGRLLVMQVHSGLAPYTDTKGSGTVRVGKDCKPLTGTVRRKIAAETGESDFYATLVAGAPEPRLSAAAMEQLRDAARRERAPAELLSLPDVELLAALGVLRRGQLTRAALLLVGRPDHPPGPQPGIPCHARAARGTPGSAHRRAWTWGALCLGRAEWRMKSPEQQFDEQFFLEMLPELLDEHFRASWLHQQEPPR